MRCVPRTPSMQYGIAVAVTLLMLAAIQVFGILVYPVPNPTAICLLAVAYAAFIGGVGPGLAAAAITLGHSALFFSEPGSFLQFTSETVGRFVVLLGVTPAIAILVGTLRNRMEGQLTERGRLQALQAQLQERSQAAEQLRAAHVSAEAASRAKTRFLASMSHELRTPLNAIVGFSEVLRDGHFGKLENPRHQEYLETVHSSAVHLRRLVEDLFDIAEVESGRLKLADAPVNLAASLSTALAMLRDEVERRRIELLIDNVRSMPSLRSDERVLVQILLNLLEHVISAAPSGAHVQVEASWRAGGDLVIRVADPNAILAYGALASQDDDPFVARFDRQGSSLSLARSLLELHGGTLRVTVGERIGNVLEAIFPASRIVPAETRPA